MTTNEEWLRNPECGEGWVPLINELHTSLVEVCPDYTIGQIKEKFGTLRYYAYLDLSGMFVTHEQRKMFYDLIALYEQMSGTTCELCGKGGNLGSVRNWYSTRCPECAPEGWEAH